VEEKFQENKKKIFEVEDLIDTLGKSISTDLYTAVRRATHHLQKNSTGDGS
jgi:hypothetical protein